MFLFFSSFNNKTFFGLIFWGTLSSFDVEPHINVFLPDEDR